MLSQIWIAMNTGAFLNPETTRPHSLWTTEGGDCLKDKYFDACSRLQERIKDGNTVELFQQSKHSEVFVTKLWP